MKILSKAVMIATRAHKGMFRKFSHCGDPYILHPMRVAGLTLLASPACVDEKILAAAWCHDVLEDTPWTEEDLVQTGLHRDSIDLVKILTRPTLLYSLHRSRGERVAEMIEKLRNAPYAAKLIKLADRCDNIHDIATDMTVPKDFALLYAGESYRLGEALRGTNDLLEAKLFMLLAYIENKRKEQ